MTVTVTLNNVALTNLNAIDLYSETDPSVRSRGQYIRVKRFAQAFSATGEHEVATLPQEGPTVGYKCLHIELGTNPGVSDYVTIKVGGNSIQDRLISGVNTVLANFCRRTPQAAYTYADFGRNNSALTSFLPMQGITDFRVVTDWTVQPTTYNIYAEQVCGLIPAPASK
jgi:hypothetical protein